MAGNPLPERVEQALRLLRLSPLVVEATPVPDKDLAAMLAPWLGDGPLPDDLPVPALIDVVLKPGANVVDSLRDLLKPVAGAALGTLLAHQRTAALRPQRPRVALRARWRKPVRGLARQERAHE